MSHYQLIKQQLKQTPKVWLITGVAGFIGSNLLETLLKLGQTVVGLDNFATGHQKNLTEVKHIVGNKGWQNFTFIEGDIRNLATCKSAVKGVDFILHQAALGSVPRSLSDPITTNDVNNNGFLNMLVASRDEQIKSFVYAASSSTYGDHPGLPKVEDTIGKPLSPYAITKYVNELYADVFAKSYGFNTIGLRYFNVFGKRQDPNGAYAAVIPKWTAAMINNEDVYINGDGETSRDFCFIENTVQMNLLASFALSQELSQKAGQEAGQNEQRSGQKAGHNKAQKIAQASNQVYNVALGDRTTLNALFSSIASALTNSGLHYTKKPVYRAFRAGDVRHSQADISKAKKLLGYQPEYVIDEGIDIAMQWYVEQLATRLSNAGGN